MITSVEFREAILAAVDKGLSHLSEPGKMAMYYQMNKTFHVNKNEIPEKVAAFHEALDYLLGFGGKVLEDLIAEDLYLRLHIAFETHPGWHLPDYLKNAETHLKDHST